MRREIENSTWYKMSLATGIALMLAPGLMLLWYLASLVVMVWTVVVIVCVILFVIGLVTTIKALDNLGIIQ